VIYRFAGHELDAAESRLLREGAPVEVQPKVLDALRLFVENPGRLLSKEELLRRLWPDVVVGEESLTQVIRKLRVALGDDPQEPRFVQTVLKRGYRFLPAVEAVDRASEPEPVPVPQTAETRAARPARPIGVAAAAAAGLLLVLALGFAFRGRELPAPGEPDARETRLTATPARESFPAISPDGARYAFVRPTEPTGEFDLFVAALDGGESRLTASDAVEFAPAFSPDGRWILYSTRGESGSEVWRIPSLGGAAEVVVVDGEWGTWSPDGARVAYLRRIPGGGSEVRSRSLTSGEEAILWRLDGPLEALAWSPDGARLAAVASNRVVVGPAGSEARPTPLGPVVGYVRSVAWEPDGGALIADGRWAGTGGNLVRLSLADGVPRPVTRGASGLYHPTLSADGRRLVYAVEHKVRQIWRFDGDRRAAGELALPTGIECFDVSPDGRTLAATDWLAADLAATLALFEIEGGARRTLGSGLCPAFSPDGRALAFLGHREEDLGLWRLDLETGERRRIAEDHGDTALTERNAARRPAFSPDGRRIAFEATRRAEGSGLFVVDVEGGATRMLAPGVYGNLAWSPDGRWIAASGAGEASGFALIEVATGTVRRALAGSAYRASAVWLGGEALFLGDQVTRPAHVPVEPRTLAARAPMPFVRAPDSSFWGLFEALPDRRGGWLTVVERYESDLFLLERAPREAAP
jgi:Tol biopolymer transport system component/DNA-binding winged helix-turn-helix (wHTH) protein